MSETSPLAAPEYWSVMSWAPDHTGANAVLAMPRFRPMNAPKSPLAVAVSMSPRVVQLTPLARRNPAMVSLLAVALWIVPSQSWFDPTVATTLTSAMLAAYLPSITPASTFSTSSAFTLLVCVSVNSVRFDIVSNPVMSAVFSFAPVSPTKMVRSIFSVIAPRRSRPIASAKPGNRALSSIEYVARTLDRVGLISVTVAVMVASVDACVRPRWTGFAVEPKSGYAVTPGPTDGICTPSCAAAVSLNNRSIQLD